MKTHNYYIKKAIEQAYMAKDNEEEPFGSILVYNNEILHSSYSKTNALNDPTAHAEIQVIREFCSTQKIHNLDGFIIYCSSEPCVMCAGAIKWSKISKIIYSVPQYELQKLTGGRIKPSCEKIVNTGYGKIEVVGLIELELGLLVFNNFSFIEYSEKYKKKYSNH